MATNARAVPLALVSVYEVGVRLQQALLLLGANESPSARGMAAVRQALTLLRVAFARLLAATPLAGWRNKVEATLDGAERDWEWFGRCEEDFDKPWSLVVGRVNELVGVAEHSADPLAVDH